jgi:hypothetical protein
MKWRGKRTDRAGAKGERLYLGGSSFGPGSGFGSGFGAAWVLALLLLWPALALVSGRSFF